MNNIPNYSSLFYFNPLPSWVYDLETFQILDVNQAAITFYGYTKEAFLGLNVRDLRPKSEIPKLVEAHTNIETHEGNIYFGVFTHQKKNGELIRMKINGHKVDYLDKVCMMVVCQDVTQEEEQLKALKASEEALRISEARFRTIFEIASLGIAQVDPSNGQIILVNSYYEIITGYTTKELLQMSFVELTHPDDRETDWDVFTKAMRGEQEYRNAKRYIKKDGSIVWVRVHLAFIRNEKGKPIRTVAICEDITVQKEEEQRLKLLESVITNTNDAILITEAKPLDEPGPRILYVNEAFTKMTGYTAEEVIGKSPRLLQGPKSDQAELARLKKALKNWESCEITTINYKKNGEEFWINLSVSPVADEKGWYTHWIAIERDVTEHKQKEVEKELLRKISLDFSFENDLTTAVNKLCKTVTEYGNFDFVELWKPNIENTQVRLISHHSTTSNADVFYKWSKDVKSLEFNEGLPGRVWKKKSSVLWNKISQKNDFIRKGAAKKAKIHSALGIPLLFNNNIVGVLVIATQKDAQYLKNYVNLFNQFEQFIGSEINRKKLEHDLSHLYNVIPDIICVVDFQGRFLKMNQAGCNLLGYSENEILYHTFDEFIFPGDKDITAKELAHQAKGKDTLTFENRYLTKNGEICWLSWNCNTSPEEGLVYATAKNITPEKKLRELNQTTSKLARMGSWEVDLKKNKTYWSEMVHELHETSPDNFNPDLAQGINFYREDFIPIVTEAVNQCIQSGTPFDFEAVIVTAKKNELWIRSIGNAEFMDGQCIRIYGSFQDIDDRKEAELRLQSLANNLPGVALQYIIYPDGTDSVLHVTEGAEQLWGYTADQVMNNLGLVWNQVKEGGDYAKLRAAMEKAILSQSKFSTRWRYLMPSGELKTQVNFGTPTLLPDGSVLFNAVIFDITQEAKNEEMLEEVTEMAKIGSWELDLINQPNNAMYWSPMTRQILEVDERYNSSLTESFEFYAEESKTHVQQAIDNLIETGKEFDEELLITTATGKEKWIRCIGKSERVKDTCVKIYGSFQDIHASKSLEIQILEILESIGDAFFSVNKDWVVTYWNKEAEKVLDIKRDEIIGKNLWERYPNLIDSEFYRQYHKAMQTGETVHFEEQNPSLGKWFEISAYPTSNNLSVYFRDITLRKEADIRLLEANERFEIVTEATNDAIWDFDMVNNHLFWGKGFDTLFGYNPDDIKPTFDFLVSRIHEDDRERIVNQINKYMTDPKLKGWYEEYRFLKADNTYAFVIDRAVFIRNSKGIVERVIGAMNDITQRKNFEQQLLELNESLKKQAHDLELSNEELEQFAFIASHDLQEPLRMVTSFMDQLKRKYENQLDEKALQYIHFATDGAKRMKKIILDLLEYSRAGKFSEATEVIDLNELLENYEILRRKVINDKSVEIRIDKLPKIESHEAPLTQILHCLLDNAINYSKAGQPPVIDVSAKDLGDFWEIKIADNGIGIDPKFYKNIFIIFQRLHNRDKYEGTGIGLSIVKKHVESWGGKIWLESHVGEGSSFYFTIPKHKKNRRI